MDQIKGEDDYEAVERIRRRQAQAAPGRSPRTVAGRKALERRALMPGDGRLRRVTGRTAQLNVTIYPELKEWITEASHLHRMTIVEIVELAMGLAKVELAKKGGKRA